MHSINSASHSPRQLAALGNTQHSANSHAYLGAGGALLLFSVALMGVKKARAHQSNAHHNTEQTSQELEMPQLREGSSERDLVDIPLGDNDTQSGSRSPTTATPASTATPSATTPNSAIEPQNSTESEAEGCSPIARYTAAPFMLALPIILGSIAAHNKNAAVPEWATMNNLSNDDTAALGRAAKGFGFLYGSGIGLVAGSAIQAAISCMSQTGDNTCKGRNLALMALGFVAGLVFTGVGGGGVDCLENADILDDRYKGDCLRGPALKTTLAPLAIIIFLGAVCKYTDRN